jgi:hypothetical protein
MFQGVELVIERYYRGVTAGGTNREVGDEDEMKLSPFDLILVGIIALLLYGRRVPDGMRSLGRATSAAWGGWFLRDWHGRIWDAAEVWSMLHARLDDDRPRQFVRFMAGIGMDLIIVTVTVCFWYLCS